MFRNYSMTQLLVLALTYFSVAVVYEHYHLILLSLMTIIDSAIDFLICFCYSFHQTVDAFDLLPRFPLQQMIEYGWWHFSTFESLYPAKTCYS